MSDQEQEISARHRAGGRVTFDGRRADYLFCLTCETPMPCDPCWLLEQLAAERAARLAAEQSHALLADDYRQLQQDVAEQGQQLAALRAELDLLVGDAREYAHNGGDVLLVALLMRCDQARALLAPPAAEGERPVQRPRLIRDPDESEPYHGPPLELQQPLRRAKRIALSPSGEHCLCACGVSADSELTLELHVAKNHRPSDDEQADQEAE